MVRYVVHIIDTMASLREVLLHIIIVWTMPLHFSMGDSVLTLTFLDFCSIAVLLLNTLLKQKTAVVLAREREVCSKSYPLCAMSIPAIGTVLLFSCTIMTVKTVQFNMNYLWIHCDTYEAPTKSILIHTYFSFISRIKKSCKKWPLLRCTQTLSRTSGATRVLQVLYGKQSDPLPENNQKAETNTHAHPGSAEPVFMHAAPMVCITQASSSIGASKRPAEISVHLV